MITIVHGGQSGVDRGAHEGASANGWNVTGYMPRDVRDEYGLIPLDVARWLIPHDSILYAKRTEANVRSCAALLIVVRDAKNPRETPGTRKTIELAVDRRLLPMVVDPSYPPGPIAAWIWHDLIASRALSLPLEGRSLDPSPPMRLMIAGPRESKWPGARVATAALLQHVGLELRELGLRGAPARPSTDRTSA